MSSQKCCGGYYRIVRVRNKGKGKRGGREGRVRWKGWAGRRHEEMDPCTQRKLARENKKLRRYIKILLFPKETLIPSVCPGPCTAPHFRLTQFCRQQMSLNTFFAVQYKLKKLPNLFFRFTCAVLKWSFQLDISSREAGRGGWGRGGERTWLDSCNPDK